MGEMTYSEGDYVKYEESTVLGPSTGRGQVLSVEEGMAVIDCGVVTMVAVEDIECLVDPEEVIHS